MSHPPPDRVLRCFKRYRAAKMFEKVANQVKLAVELSCSVTDCLRTLTLHATGSFPGSFSLLETCKDAVVRQTNLHVAARFLHKSQCRGIHKTCRRDGKVNCNKVSSHGPNPKRINCQKISITQCKTASKATQILPMRIKNRMNSHISPYNSLLLTPKEHGFPHP